MQSPSPLLVRLHWGTVALGLLAGVTPAMSTAQEAASGPAPVSVTLEEAISRGLEHAPQVAQAAGATRNAAAAERSALGAYLPSLSANAGGTLGSSNRFNPQTATPVTGSSTSLNAGLSASWEVFSGGRRGAEQAAARAQAGAAESGLTQQRADTSLQVETAFYEEQRAEELLAVARARLERAQQGVEAAERRAKVGSATRSDVLRAQLELNTAREALRQAQTQHVTAGFALGRLIGVDGPADARLEGPISPTPLAVSDEELLASLAHDAPTVRAAEANAQAAQASVGAARAQYLPSLRLSAGYSWYNQQLPLANTRGAWSTGLNLSVPIFDGFARDEAVVRAQTEHTVVTAQLEDTRRALRSEAAKALAELKLQQERIGFTEQAVSVAQEDLRVQQERYRLGVSTMLDLLTSQENLVDAERSLVTARFDYQLARARLEALAGRRL
jgi:outer membrane protein